MLLLLNMARKARSPHLRLWSVRDAACDEAALR